MGNSIDITLPPLGESVTEGVVARWVHSEGDHVTEGETVVEVSTDKVDVEVPAPATGTLAIIHAREGTVVPIGSVLAVVAAGDEAPTADASPSTAPSAPTGPPVDVHLPEMGESVSEGTISRWLVAVGDSIEEGATLAEVSTDKVDVEVPSPVTGTVVALAAAEGSNVPVGALIATVQPGATSPASSSKPSTPAPLRVAPVPEMAPRPTTNGKVNTGSAGWLNASPLARRAATRNGIDVSTLSGDGPVRRGDVTANASRSQGPASRTDGTAKPLVGPYAALAAAMEDSRSLPTATTLRTLGVGRLVAERSRLNASLKTAGTHGISYTHIIAYALVRAASARPEMCAVYGTDEQGHPARIDAGIHLGIAVDTTRKDGGRFLLVPVIRDAASRSVSDFVEEFNRLVGLARDGKLAATDLQGATFSLTNPGGLGTSASVPRLMAGQGSIIACGALSYPVGLTHISPALASQLGIEQVMTVTSTYDHRVIQGAQSGEYLAALEALLSTDDSFYTDLYAGLGQRWSPLPPVAPSESVSLPTSLQGTPTTASSTAALAIVARAVDLVRAYRIRGVLGAHLDPLGSPPSGDPSLDPQQMGLSNADLASVPTEILDLSVPGATLAQALPHLKDIYCGHVAFEVEHLDSDAERSWLHEQIETGEWSSPLDPEKSRWLLDQLIRVEGMESYLRKQFLGQKTFSSEGVDIVVPMLERLFQTAAADQVEHAIIGMSHRGRLATIAHACNRPYDDVLGTFEHAEENERDLGSLEMTGDVKYHLGADGNYVSPSGESIHVRLLSNPSHLEAVDPVVEGWVRALQTDISGTRNEKAALPILVHGDAAFAAQGIVAEVFNLHSLPGYATGGTIHIIANNQIGFTTMPQESRSTRWSSDLAKGFDVPIFHVNADEPDSAIRIAELAWAYRCAFHKDVLIDVVGYRRFGHNEADEPSYTQPQMYEVIGKHPTVARIYGDKLIARHVVDEAAFASYSDAVHTKLTGAHARVKASLAPRTDPDTLVEPVTPAIPTSVAKKELDRCAAALVTLPTSFTPNVKLMRQMERRHAAYGGGTVDWALAEALALGSLLAQGVSIRMTGQDTERGTFSQRHLALHSITTDEVLVPVASMATSTSRLELHNSPLSEVAALGFEYGYSVAYPQVLVAWEAQFGDFANNAQLIIDQFIAAGRAKWGQESRLTLLLPHGYEGAGPEHSSARLERFLQLSAGGEMRVANCSTAAQYFHLLRDQALQPHPRPLVVMTPKSLLRLKDAGSSVDELAQGHFFPLLRPIVDNGAPAPTRLVLCSGKVYYELMQAKERATHPDVVVARLEQLAPFPTDDVVGLIHDMGASLESVVWVQEEPANMGGWLHVWHHLAPELPLDVPLIYVGRPERAAPSEGYVEYHRLEQLRITRDAYSVSATATRSARSTSSRKVSRT